MFKNYFKTAWRNILRNKIYSFINIVGLAMGMAVALMIGLWIHDELSYNKYHANYDRLGRVMNNSTFSGEVITHWSEPLPLGNELKSKFADFDDVAMASWSYGHIIEYGDRKFNKEAIYAEPQLIQMLSLKMLHGSKDGLKDIRSVILTESFSKLMFGSDNPIGKTVKIANRIPLKVTGVFEDLPHNSFFSNLDFFLPWELYLADNPWVRNSGQNWGNFSFQTFVQLNSSAEFDRVSAKMKNVIIDKDPDNMQKATPFVHPMSKWHLYADFKNGVNTGGRIQFVWLFGIIGIIVLLLACINFVNLSTARAEKRAKEVGIRKTVGSRRNQLVSQFLFESILVVGLAFAICLFIVQLTLPWFNDVADKKLNLLWKNQNFWVLSLGFILITSLLSGSYPAIFLSSFNPIKVFKGMARLGRHTSVPRKVLVVIQFTVSVTLIIGTLVVYYQVQFGRTRPIGYNRHGLITTWMAGLSTTQFDAIRNDLSRSGAIENIAASTSPTTAIWSNQSDFDWEGKPPDLVPNFGTVTSSYDYGKTIGYQILGGRDFSRDFATDSSSIIINEAAAKFIGITDPVDKPIKFNFKPHTIIGVVRNIIMESPYEPIRPTVYFLAKNRVPDFYTLRLNRKLSAQEALRRIEPIYKKYNFSNPFEYRFVDEEYDEKFQSEERAGKLATVFALLAVFISCLGLFGLASFIAEQRTKEIGIRKVLGASIFKLWIMMSKEFTLLVCISCMVAIPIGYFFMHRWLQDYTYRVTIGWSVFVVAGMSALLIALITVSFQSIKAAIANPVKSLRTE